MLIDEKQSIWSEKYKPQTIDDVILPENIRNSIKTGLEKGTLPNLGLWSYLPGLGKSSLANAIANHENVEPYWVNASLNKGIDLIRNEIHAFASRRSFDGRLKVVIMDECDRPTTAQASPRSQGSARLRFWRYWISMRCKNAPRRPHQIIWGRRGHAKNSPDYQQLTKESRAESLTATRSEIQKLLLSNLRNILFCQAGHIQNSIHV